jgi:CO dehydrogenase maturation factor
MQNRPNTWPQDVLEHFDEEHIAVLPDDPLLVQFDIEGKPTSLLPDEALIVRATNDLFERLLSGGQKK